MRGAVLVKRGGGIFFFFPLLHITGFQTCLSPGDMLNHRFVIQNFAGIDNWFISVVDAPYGCACPSFKTMGIECVLRS